MAVKSKGISKEILDEIEFRSCQVLDQSQSRDEFIETLLDLDDVIPHVEDDYIKARLKVLRESMARRVNELRDSD